MITILDGNFKKVDILRKYEYLQYTEPIRDIGTFELRATLNDDTRRFIKAAELQYYYLMFDETYIAKIEKITQSDEETGIDTVVITGRNSLFILAKRVIKGTVEFNGKTAQYIKTLIELNVTGAELGKRRINAEVILDDEEYLLTQCNTINKQVTGGYVWDEVLDALEQDKLGIYMIPILQNVSETEDYNVDHWEIHITAGVNRTKGNYLGNPSVTFSQSLSNIARTTYERDITNFGTIYYVAGEGEGEDRKWFEVADKEEEELASGWDRAEIWVDARDVQSTIDGGNTELTDEDYEGLIVNRAGEKMKEHQESVMYDATITRASRPYVYGTDYKRADFVTVVDNKLGIEVQAQIVGLTTTYQGAQVIRDVNFLYGSVKGDPIRQIQQNNQNTGDNTVNIKYVENLVVGGVRKTVYDATGDLYVYNKVEGRVDVIGTRVYTASGDYVGSFTRDNIVELINRILPTSEKITASDIDVSKNVVLVTWDGDSSGHHFYSPEWWSGYNRFFQYFYPSVSGNIRVNFKLTYYFM